MLRTGGDAAFAGVADADGGESETGRDSAGHELQDGHQHRERGTFLAVGDKGTVAGAGCGAVHGLCGHRTRGGRDEARSGGFYRKAVGERETD